MNRELFLHTYWQPYPSAPKGGLDVAAFRRAAGRPGVTVCGRLQTSGDEPSGGVGGAKWRLVSGGEEIEVRFSQRARWLGLPADAAFAEAILRAGDLVAVELVGENDAHAVFEVQQVLLLAPNLAAAKANSAFDQNRSKQWAEFLATVRDFFTKREFIQTATPTLVPSPGTEPYLDPFRTEWIVGSRRTEFFLPTSPEFHLKKLLVQGWTRIFEIKTCFRNDEVGPHHQPEFQMLEWYRAYDDLDTIADDVEALFTELARLRPGKRESVFRRTTMAALFSEAFGGFALKPQTTREELVALARASNIVAKADDSWDDVFFRLFLARIEPALGKDGPLLVRGYPPSQAALARIGPDGFADRFEVYWRGLEIANAFHELNDPKENEVRFSKDRARKLAIGKSPVPIDDELVQGFRHGMPPSGGIALGLERLFMALFELDDIAATRAFPAARPENDESS